MAFDQSQKKMIDPVKVTSQEKWATLIFIYCQECTQILYIYTQREVPETMVPSPHLALS